MTVVTENVDLPAGVDPTQTVVTVSLAGENGEPLTEAYDTVAGRTIAGKRVVALDSTGGWSLDLAPNSTLDPAGTAWRRTLNGHGTSASSLAEVPVSGPVVWGPDILVDAPAAIAPSALGVQAARIDALERDPAAAVRRFQSALSITRNPNGFPIAMAVIVGDSLTEGYATTTRDGRWTHRAATTLAADSALGISSYIPAAANTNNETSNAAAWPGGTTPWTYSGTVGSAGPLYGMSLHAITVAGGFVELAYHGDIVNFLYVRTPEAAGGGYAVTIDGQAAGTLNANGSLLAGQQSAAFGTIGDIDDHVIRITVGSGTLTLEGAVVVDGIGFFFGVPLEGVGILNAGHAGFSVPHFTATDGWARSIAALSSGGAAGAQHGVQLVGIALGANDLALAPGAGGTPAEYRAGLVSMMATCDARMAAAGRALPGYLLIEMPGLPATWVEAAWQAAEAHDPARCSVLDLASAVEPATPTWGLMDSAGHPGDGGQVWLANSAAEALNIPRDRQILSVGTTAGTVAAGDDSRFASLSAAGAALAARVTTAEANNFQQVLWLPADAMDSTAGTKDVFAVPKWLLNHTAGGHVYYTFRVPFGWTTMHVDLWWVNFFNGAGGDVRWWPAFHQLNDGTNLNALTGTIQTQLTETAGSYLIVKVTRLFTGQAVTAGQRYTATLFRDGAHAADTLGGNAGVIALLLTKAS